MEREAFFREFRQEHREIRDLLFDMITSFLKHDFEKAGALLESLNSLTGPHFRYEEERLYPALIEIYGEQYINKLLTDHDLAIARAKKLNSMIKAGSKEKNDITDCVNTVRSILPHVSDCEGLSIMVEKLDDKVLGTICNSVEEARKANIPLIEWSETSRTRKPLQIKEKI
jgi:hypothetical protein